MKEFKKYELEPHYETFCVFDFDESRNFAEIIGAEHFCDVNEWYYFALGTFCDCNRLDDSDYINWLLYDENDGNGFGCGSYSSLEELIASADKDYLSGAELLGYFLENNC